MSFLIGPLLVGCNGGPSGIALPDIDPHDAAELAMKTYDTDGNGYVEGDELKNAPGLAAAMTTLDTNGDAKVSGKEISERILAWQGTEVGIMSITCTVLMDGRPLEGATVTLDPEEFLGNDIQEAVGVSGPMGDCYPSIPQDESAGSNIFGVQFGLFKVRVSKVVDGKEQIPGRYNSQTVLGQEVSYDDPAMLRNKVIFRLRNK